VPTDMLLRINVDFTFDYGFKGLRSGIKELINKQ
jgi:hypothetical protein